MGAEAVGFKKIGLVWNEKLQVTLITKGTLTNF